jgi:DNA-directed RNA polymerase subunit RPC12/RpoP
MGLLDHPTETQRGLKIVCEVCGSLSIKPIDPAEASDAEVRCRRCNAVRGTIADLRALARQSTGDFEF